MRWPITYEWRNNHWYFSEDMGRTWKRGVERGGKK